MKINDQNLVLERLRHNLTAAAGTFPLDFYEDEKGNIVFPIEDTSFSIARLVSGQCRYGITLSENDNNDEIIRKVSRGIRSLRNQLATADLHGGSRDTDHGSLQEGDIEETKK